MRQTVILLLLLASVGVLHADEGKPKKPKKPPIPGIHWEPDFEAGMRRAALEGRPILFCVNALEEQVPQLVTQLYRSEEWGTASRGYVCFACNPNDHTGPDGLSTRFLGVPSKSYNAALTYVLKHFGPDLISPSHIILEPDGELAYRKDFYTNVVGPALLRRTLTSIAPGVAYSRAAIDREDRIKRVVSSEAPGGEARAWLKSGDGYAMPGILNALDEIYDVKKRVALIGGCTDAPGSQLEAMAYGADERLQYPDDEPEETLAWVQALLAADREMGVRAAALAIARAPERTLRDSLLKAWAGKGPMEAVPAVKALPKDEQAAAVEALLLAADARGKTRLAEQDWAMEMRLERARVKAGVKETKWPALRTALDDGSPGPLRGSLLEADAADVRANEMAIGNLLDHDFAERIRVAAALALLGGECNKHTDRVVEVLLSIVFDPIEGPETRRHAVEHLGEDPGLALEEWEAAIRGRMGASR